MEDPFLEERRRLHEPGGAQQILVPPEGKDKPSQSASRSSPIFRRSIYDAQCQHGRMTPSSAAPPPTEAQARCTHPFEALRWAANADGHYARCKRCDLKHVVYYSVRHGVLMVSMDHAPPPEVPAEAKVWIREDKMAKHFKMMNKGGPAWEQVQCRGHKGRERAGA